MAIIPIFIPTYINSPEYTPARVQPRLLFYNGLLDCEPYYIESGSNTQAGIGREQTAFPYFDNYNVVTGSFPTVNSNSLLFYNEEAVYGEVPTDSLYSTYWQKYVELLYNPRTKLLNVSAIIPLAEYFKISQNDIIQFRGNYYHLRAINDYNLKNGECSLQLLGPILADALNLNTVYYEYCMGYSITECADACLNYWNTCGVIFYYEYCMGYSVDNCSLACIDAQTCPTTTTSTTTTTTEAPIEMEYLVVAGGGASGGDGGGGGGGGGLLSGSIVLSPFNTLYTIKVGLGGSTTGANGQTSSISFTSASIAFGGGGGGTNTTNGSVGGSGGGNGGSTNLTINNNIIGQGNIGGAGNGSFGQPRAAGGGGGASQVGGNASENGVFLNSYRGGDGGSGSQWLDGNFYAGGGGGGGNGNNFGSGPGGLGGPGGGGNGGNALNSPTGVTGSVNTGGGGGGSFTFKAGGSGMVKLRYFGSGSQAIGGQISYSGSYTYHTFTSSGTFTY